MPARSIPPARNPTGTRPAFPIHPRLIESPRSDNALYAGHARWRTNEDIIDVWEMNDNPAESIGFGHGILNTWDRQGKRRPCIEFGAEAPGHGMALVQLARCGVEISY